MNAENAGPPNRVTVAPSSSRRASRGASRLSPALLAEARPLRFRYVERSSSDCAPVHDHVDIVPPGPRHSRRVNGKRERRLQLARSERHTSQLEHHRRAHSASLDEMHRHIDEKLLSCRGTLQFKRHRHATANPHPPRSRRHAFSQALAALPISVRLWFTTRLFTGGRIKYSTPVWVSRAAGHITGRREQCAATG